MRKRVEIESLNVHSNQIAEIKNICVTKKLALYDCSRIEKLDFSIFQKAQNLLLINLINLKEITNLPEDKAAFKNLKSVQFKNCLNLKITEGFLKSLTNLESLMMCSRVLKNSGITETKFGEIFRGSDCKYSIFISRYYWNRDFLGISSVKPVKFEGFEHWHF